MRGIPKARFEGDRWRTGSAGHGFCLISYLLILFLLNQTEARAQKLPMEDVYHTVWLTKDGAPRGITSLAESPGGYLWIGTNIGLYRFDGGAFSELPTAPEALPSRRITAVVADEADGIWAGFDHKAISHIADHGQTTNVLLPDNYKEETVRDIICAHGAVWILVGKAVLRFDRKSGIFEDFDVTRGSPHASFLSIFMDDRGTIWAGSRKGVYFLASGADHFSFMVNSPKSVVQMFQTGDGVVWGNVAGVGPRPLTRECASRPLSVFDGETFAVDTRGRLWLADAGRGIRRTAAALVSCPALQTTESFDTSAGLSSNATHAALVDHFGDVWIGTELGLDRFRPRPFQPFGKQDFASYPSMALSDGTMWIHRYRGRLEHIDPNSTREIGTSWSTGPIASDLSGGVWLYDPSFYTMKHYARHGKLLRSVPVPAVFRDDDLQTLTVAQDHSVLLGFRVSGLWCYRSRWERLSDLGLPKESTTTLRTIGNTVWLGFFDNHVSSRSGSTIRNYSVADGLDIDTTLDIIANGSLVWVAGTEGIDFLQGGHFHRLNVRRPERLRGISGIAFDDSGDLWINNGAGAMRIRASEISKVLTAPTHEAVSSVFGNADGVIGQPAQSTPTPSLLKDRSGRLWFGTAGHLVTLLPGSVDSEPPSPNLDLQEVSVNGRPLTLADLRNHAIVLDGAMNNRVEFSFGAVDLDHPNHIVYRYRLDGADKDWQVASTARKAVYTKLPAGTYRFRFSATNGQDRWTEFSLPDVIRVQSAYYQTAWFRLACVAFCSILAFLLYQARIRYLAEQIRDRLEHRSKERLRIARDLHDTLLQSIHGLMLRFHYTIETLSEDDPARPALQKALQRADAFILEGRNKVQELRGESYEDTTLSEMLAEVVQHAEGLQQDGQTTDIQIQITEDGVKVPLCRLVLEELSTIGRECILNAIKHSKGSRIDVALLYKRNIFSFRCRDNGVGIPKRVLEEGGLSGHWGLQGIRERAHALGSRIDIWTEDGKGTEIEITLSGKAAYRRKNGFRRYFGLIRES